MKVNLGKIVIVALFALIPPVIAGQTTKRKAVKKPTNKPTPATSATPQPTPEITVDPAPKKNDRPADAKANARGATAGTVVKKSYTPAYIYTFDRPGFTYSSIKIEHDEDGKGRIWFKKDGYDEMLDDPIELSRSTLERLKGAFAGLNFLDSTENYQYAAHDFSNMGNITITFRRDGRTRTAKYNWTENKGAKILMDEYRAIGNEYTWKFEITGASQNQPLLTPGLIDALDTYLKRNEISDPPHLLPYLTKLSTDERMPLMARNHVVKLIAQIEKAAKKR